VLQRPRIPLPVLAGSDHLSRSHVDKVRVPRKALLHIVAKT
jgi:hypothetical protein